MERKIPLKIIFLDFDGVITTEKSGYSIDPEKVDLLHQIINETGAKIVISSSWRTNDLESTKEQFKDTSFVNDIIGITRRLYIPLGNDKWMVVRGVEIKEWLDNCDEDIKSYVILDDETDLLLEQKDNFVKTDTYLGLSEENVKQAIKILNR